VVCDVATLLGKDLYRPWRTFKLPTLVWAVALDNKRLGRILRQRIREHLPGDEGRDWKEYLSDGIFKMSKKWGNSELHLMSCEAGPERFKGAECDLIHLDEEPNPRGGEIFNECYSRFGPGRPLDIIMTFTPDQGATWSHSRLFDETSEDYLRGGKGEKIVDFFEFSLFDCDIEKGGHLTHEEIMRQYHGYKPHERKARFFGKYSLVGSNIYYDAEQIEVAQKKVTKGEHARITINDLKQTRLERGAYGEWLLFEERMPGERYVAGFDVSGGNRKDRSVAYVIAMGLKARNDKGEIVAGSMKPRIVLRYKSDRIDPERFAREIAYPILVYYNYALGVPERNGDYGGAFMQALRDHYDNLFTDLRYDKAKMEWKGGVGWHTNESTRGMILSAHEVALREGWEVYTNTCVLELASIVEKRNPDSGKTRVEAAHGCFDDEAFAAGMALAAFIQDPPILNPPMECELYEGDVMPGMIDDGALLGLTDNRQEVAYSGEEYV